MDGYVVGMDAEVVDATGRVQGRDKVMLHHIVLPRSACRTTRAAGSPSASSPKARNGVALTAARLRLPQQGDRPLGAPLHADEPQAEAVEGLHPLPRPVRHGRGAEAGEAGLDGRPDWTGLDPVFDVPGGGKRSRPSRDRRLHDARERPARRGWGPSARRRHQGRAAQREVQEGAVRVASELGRAEAEAAPPRARANEDVGVPSTQGIPVAKGRSSGSRPSTRTRRRTRA